MTQNPIKIRLAQNTDQKRWDDYVTKHPKATPYHLYAWKQAIETAYGHQTTYLLAEKNQAILGVLPLVHLRLRPLVNQLVSLPFCDVGNCLADDPPTQDLLLKKALDCNQHHKHAALQLRGALSPTPLVQSQLQVIETGKVHLVLDLPDTSDVLFKTLKSKLRSQIRKAEKNGVTFRWGEKEDMDVAYQVFAGNMHELGSPVHSKAFLQAVLTHFLKRAKLGLAEIQGKIIGMGIILLTDQGIFIPWASTRRQYNALGTNMLLYWNFLKYGADHGYCFFDFGRSSLEEGTFKFKQQWGATPTPLIWYRSSAAKAVQENQNHLTGLKIRDYLATAWRNLPLPIANWLGPYIRKHISL